MSDIYILFDHLDSDRERTLTGYLYSDDRSKPKQVLYILVNDPLHWDVENDGAVPLFLHCMDVEPEHDRLWTIGLNYLANYARNHGYPGILTNGKSTTHSEQAVEDHLLAAGFKKLNYRRYWLDL